MQKLVTLGLENWVYNLNKSGSHVFFNIAISMKLAFSYVSVSTMSQNTSTFFQMDWPKVNPWNEILNEKKTEFEYFDLTSILSIKIDFEKCKKKFEPKIKFSSFWKSDIFGQKSWKKVIFRDFSKSAKTPFFVCFDTFLPLNFTKIEFSGIVCWHKLEGLKALRGHLHIKFEPWFQPKMPKFPLHWQKWPKFAKMTGKCLYFPIYRQKMAKID